MLIFNYGTDFKKLAERLLRDLRRNPLANPLNPEIFVVQNHGIGQWLSLFLADKEGIAANLKFEFPAERIWSLARVLDPDIPRVLPSDREPMIWSLMRLMETPEAASRYNMLSYYMQDDDPVQQEVRKWKLCQRIAEVFDQYLVFRSDLLLKWDRGQYGYEASESEQWQAGLWRQLVDQWEKEVDNRQWVHRARLQSALLEAIDKKKLDPERLPERINVFGISGMPPVMIETLAKLSKLVDVLFYRITIDPAVHEEGEYRNPLLQSLGKEGNALLTHLNRCLKADHEIRFQKNEISSAPEAPDDALLIQVKNDLKNDRDTFDKFAGGERGIQVHSCHSPRREVEVLYDQLLALLDDDQEINPDDILVMTPDIETYAPLIEAVFDAPDEGQPKIPYSIADRGIEHAHPAIQTFLKILKLVESRFKVTETMDLLDSEPLQKAFGLTDDNLNQIEKWVRENRIRWGVDGRFRQQTGVPDTESYTWKSGLNRMMLGYVMRAEDDDLFQGIYPYAEIESSGDADLAGRFSHFLNRLFEINRQVQHDAAISEWHSLLSGIADTFLPDSKEYYREIVQIRDSLQNMKDFAAMAGYQQKVPFRIIRLFLEEQLEDQATGGGRIGRGATISSLVPVRSIPFKIIAMVGMDEGAFPRSKIPAEFDLMQLFPRAGDRSRSDDDRFLFLENILSAGQHLYFSYVGQSDQQDIQFPPSVVLKEFIDYLGESYGVSAEQLVTRHRLQAFSPAYFRGGDLFSYSKTRGAVSRRLLESRNSPDGFMRADLPEAGDEFKKLTFSELIAFFQHPSRYVFKNRLGISLYEEDPLTEDREPFHLAGLDGYRLGQELLDRFVKGKPLDSYRKVVEARDMLPQGWKGEEAYHQKVREVREFGSSITRIMSQKKLEDREFVLEMDGFRIVGKLSDIYEEALIKYRFGRARPKDLIDLWLTHLVLQLNKPPSHSGCSCLFSRDNKAPLAEYRLLPIENVKPILKNLLDFYWAGLQRCTYFFPESSFAFAQEVVLRGRDADAGLKKASYQWIREYSPYPGEGEDVYNKLMLESESPCEKKQFREASLRFWEPFFKTLDRERL